jgi:hypothetical protein
LAASERGEPEPNAGAGRPSTIDVGPFGWNFDGSDAGIDFNIVVFWNSGANYALLGFNLDASNAPFSVTFPFTGFTSGVPGVPVDWGNIDYMVGVAQTGSAIGANDYAIKAFKAAGP